MSNLFVILFLISIVAFFIGLKNPRRVLLWGDDTKKTRKRSIMTYGIATFVFFVLVGATAEETPDQKAAKEAIALSATEASAKKAEEERKKKAEADEEKRIKSLLNYKGELTLSATQGKVIATLTTNAESGSIIELAVMNGEIKALSDFVEVKDGKAVKEFAIPEDWGIGHIAGTALFRFNYADKPQPDRVKTIYGNDGEKMTGSLIKDNGKGGKYASAQATVAYPDEKTVKEDLLKKFSAAIAETIKVSKGAIKSIKPRYNENWDLVNVVVDDAWYLLKDFEKERFAEQVGKSIETLVVNAGIVKNTANIYFVDTFGKDVASPKLLGGYSIK